MIGSVENKKRWGVKRENLIKIYPIIVEATEESPYLKYGYSVDIEVISE